MNSELARSTEKETVFPWSLAEEVFDLLEARDTRLVRYCDLRTEQARFSSSWRYIDEFVEFRTGKKNPWAFCKALTGFAFLRWGGWLPLHQALVRRLFRTAPPPTVILQHDADLLPERTVEMLRRQNRRGLVSSAYVFAVHATDREYGLDVAALKGLEDCGFEIGYHQNAFERANYDAAFALDLVDRDLQTLTQHFNIRSFVPHGGTWSLDRKLNNDHLPHAGALSELIWAYNGKCILKEYTWSDGAITKRAPEDPRSFVRRLARGSRAMMLMHPQYYGDKLRSDWESLPLARERWWRDLWEI